MDRKQSRFVELSNQDGTLKRINPLSIHHRLIKANFIPGSPDSQDQNQSPDLNDPRIELQKDGDFVEMIKVNCACGRSTQIILDYENDQDSAQKIHSGEIDR